MFRYVFIFWLAAAPGPSRTFPVQEDARAILVRSEALYYEEKFSESIALLTQLDRKLPSSPDVLQQKTSLKLQLALGYFALNDIAKAKSTIAEMCALDSKCAIDPEKYPPKVLSFFEMAKG